MLSDLSNSKGYEARVKDALADAAHFAGTGLLRARTAQPEEADAAAAGGGAAEGEGAGAAAERLAALAGGKAAADDGAGAAAGSPLIGALH